MPDTVNHTHGIFRETLEERERRIRESNERIRQARERFRAAERRKQAIRERLAKQQSRRGVLRGFLALFR